MHIEHLISVCLEAIAQGDSVEACLARYPAQAEELEPLLRVAVTLQSEPKAQLPLHAFQSGRSALAVAARAAQAARAGAQLPTSSDDSDDSDVTGSPEHPFHGNDIFALRGPTFPLHSPQDAPYRNGHSAAHQLPSGRSARIIPRRFRASQADSSTPAPLSQSNPYQLQSAAAPVSSKRFRFQRIAMMVATVLLVLSSVMLIQQFVGDVPATPLALVRTLGQRAEGVLMNAAGEGASWHARQTLAQIESLHTTTAGNGALSAQLKGEIENHVQQALLAASRLPTAEQARFYTDWLADLAAARAMMSDVQPAEPTAITLLDQVMAQVTTASNGVNILEVTPVATVAEDAAPVLVGTTVPTTTTIESDATEQVLTPTIPAATSLATAAPSSALATATEAAAVAPAGVNRVMDPPAFATRVLLATAMPTRQPTATPRRRVQVDVVATLPPTATPLPVITRVMPREADDSERADEALDESAAGGAVDRAPISAAPVEREGGSDNDNGRDAVTDADDDTGDDDTGDDDTDNGDSDGGADGSVPITATTFAPGGTIPQPTATATALTEGDETATKEPTAVSTITPRPSTTPTPEPPTQPLPTQTDSPALTIAPTITAVDDETWPPDATATGATDEMPVIPPNTATWTPVAHATVDETTLPPVVATSEATVAATSVPIVPVATRGKRPTAESVSNTSNPTATPQSTSQPTAQPTARPTVQPTATSEPNRAQQTRRARNNGSDVVATATSVPASTTASESVGIEQPVAQPTAETISVSVMPTSPDIATSEVSAGG